MKTKMVPIHRVVRALNVSSAISHHLFGENHTHVHKIGVGLAVMVVGVKTAAYGHHVHVEELALLLDGIGYAVHGIGLAPILEYMMEFVERDAKQAEAEEQAKGVVARNDMEANE